METLEEVLAAASASLQMHDERPEKTYAAPSSSSKRRKSVSEVWNDFDKVIIDGKDKAVCKHCKKKFAGSSKRGTKHLKNHLSRCPALKDAETQKGMMSTSLETASVGGDFVFDDERSHFDVARMIVKHGYPLDMVEHLFFQIFVKNLQPKFKLHSQDTLKADILQIYKEEKEKLFKYLGTLSCHFSLIIQFWTCHRKKNLYCCFAIQFLEDGLILKKKILALKKIDQYNAIAERTLFGAVTSLLQEWNIGEKLCSITLESSDSKNAMVRELESRIRHRACRRPLCRHFFHIHCITNIINRLLQDGLNEIGWMFHKIRSTMRYINEAPGPWKQYYQSTLEQHNLQDRYCEDVSTRWDSSFLMLESVMELRKVFSLLEGYDNDFVVVNPSVEEWDMTVVVYKCLKVLHNAIYCFSGNKCLTANVYFPKVCSIHFSLLELQKSEHISICLMAGRMIETFDKSIYECRTILASAVILDPRKKFEFVQFAFECLNGCHEAGIILAYIRKTLNAVFDDYAKEYSMQALSSSSVDGHNFTSHFDHDNCDMLSMWYEAKLHNLVASPRAELDRYLGREVIGNADRDFDILGWWRANSSDFPTLGKMALDILEIPMSTSAISDSSFNTKAMMMINPAFDGLDPEIIEALVCGEYWLDSPTKMALSKEEEEEHSSGCSPNGKPTDHDHTSMPLAAPSLTSSEFDQEKLDSLSAANTRLVFASPPIPSNQIICCSVSTARSPTLPVAVPQGDVSHDPTSYTPIMASSPGENFVNDESTMSMPEMINFLLGDESQNFLNRE